VPLPPVIVPHGELSAELLRSVVEAFVLREGTDYGPREVSLADKVADVIEQLRRGRVEIVFDPNLDTVNIVKC